MPTYDYECQSCGHSFEVMQKMSDKLLVKCPHCSKNKLIRLIGAGAGLIFKGSGFYATDYKKSAKKDTEKSSQPVCPKAKEGCNACPHNPK
jgi:putative FmdB family regulatory protein